MKIDKSKLKLGIWYTDDNLKYIPSDCSTDCQPVVVIQNIPKNGMKLILFAISVGTCMILIIPNLVT